MTAPNNVHDLDGPRGLLNRPHDADEPLFTVCSHVGRRKALDNYDRCLRLARALERLDGVARWVERGES